MSQAIDDMTAYVQLDDSVFLRILHSPDPALKDAKKILEDIHRRQLYRIIGQTKSDEKKVILMKAIDIHV
jgi:hypothetical protein